MGRTFLYCRASSLEPSIEAQIAAAEVAGYRIEPYRVIHESVSVTTRAMERPAFRTMVEHKLEPGDTLVVPALGGLGRDNVDARQTVSRLSADGVVVVSLDLPLHELTSQEGGLLCRMLDAFADFERSRARERTREGLERARRRGKTLGRPVATDTTAKVQALKAQGVSQSQAAERSGLSIATIKRHWNKRSVGAS